MTSFDMQMEWINSNRNETLVNTSEAISDDWKIDRSDITEQMVLSPFPLSNHSEQNYSAILQNSSSNGSTAAFKVWRANLYRTVVPVMLAFCVVTIIFNLSILLSMKWVKKRSSSPTLCFSVSLAVADAYSSLVIGLGLLINSLLPYGYDIHLGSGCHTMVLEAFRLAGPIISVLHLLALAINHYIGILRPLHYASMVTKQKAFITIGFIWILPCLYIFVYFTSIPNQGFLSYDCRIAFLLHRTFRLAFSVIFFVPLFAMAFIYLHIFFIVRQHHAEAGQYQNHMKKNVKAIVTTLLILGTYVVGWMPAVVIYVLFCLNCLLSPSLISGHAFLIINIIINSLIILKSLIDSLVYAIRNQEIHRALVRMRTSVFCSKVDEFDPVKTKYSQVRGKSIVDAKITQRESGSTTDLKDLDTGRATVLRAVNGRHGSNCFI